MSATTILLGGLALAPVLTTLLALWAGARSRRELEDMAAVERERRRVLREKSRRLDGEIFRVVPRTLSGEPGTPGEQPERKVRPIADH